MAINQVQSMIRIKLYAQAAIEGTILAWITLADVDAFIRVSAGSVTLVLTLLTIYKVLQRIRTGKIEYEQKKLELQMKQEQVRRYFEQKYNETKPSSDEIPRSIGIEGEQISG